MNAQLICSFTKVLSTKHVLEHEGDIKKKKKGTESLPASILPPSPPHPRLGRVSQRHVRQVSRQHAPLGEIFTCHVAGPRHVTELGGPRLISPHRVGYPKIGHRVPRANFQVETNQVEVDGEGQVEVDGEGQVEVEVKVKGELT